MSQFKNIYYAEVVVEVAATIEVAANSENEAFGRLNDGAWYGVLKPDWDHAKVKKLGPITKGPGLCPR